MSRRQLVGAAMVSPAVVMNAIADNGVEEDPALDLWRQWRKALAEWSEANERYDNADTVLPRALGGLRDEEDARLWNHLIEMEDREPKPLSAERAAYYEENFLALEARQKARDEGRLARGVTVLKERADRAEAAQYAAIGAIEALRSASPIAVAARLHVALDWELDDSEDWATRMAVSIVRDLMPHLPKEMAAALKQQIKGMGSWRPKRDSTQTV